MGQLGSRADVKMAEEEEQSLLDISGTPIRLLHEQKLVSSS